MAEDFGLGDLASTLFSRGSDAFDVGSFSVPANADYSSALTSGGGGGGWWDTFGNIAKSALPFAQIAGAGAGIGLGIQGATQLAGQTKIAENAAKGQSKIGSEAAGFARDQIARAESGQVTPAVQAQIDQWASGAKQQARDQAARTGQGDSTQLKQWEAWIDQQAMAMRASYLQQQEQMGLQGYNIAAGAYGGSGQGATQQQGGLEQLIAGANQVLARLSQGAT